MWDKVRKCTTSVANVVKKVNDSIDNFERRVTGKENGVDDFLDEGWAAAKNWAREAEFDLKCRLAARKLKKIADAMEAKEETQNTP